MKYLWLAQLVPFAILLYLYFQNRSMKKRQDALANDLQGQRYWRINLAKPEFYKRWLRFMPFEAKGLLIDEGNQLRIKGFWVKTGKVFDSSFDKQSSTLQWLGNNQLRAGNLHWARLSTPRGELLFTADTGMYALPSREALSDIFRSVFPEYALSEEHTTDFALEKNLASVSMVVVFFGLFLFSLLDTFAITRFELTDAQLFRILAHPLVWIGTLAGFGISGTLAYRYMLGAGVPARESMVLGTLVAAALVGAALPIAKRVDQVMAATSTQNHMYRIVDVARLEPVATDQNLPTLRFPRARDYWQQQPVGSEYPIPFLQGPMGLWQLDHMQFDPPLPDFSDKPRR